MPSFEVQQAGAFSSLLVKLKKSESIHAESDSMVTTTEHVRIGSSLSRGLWASIARSLCAQQSLFQLLLTADEKNSGDDESVVLASAMPGSISLLCLRGGTGYNLRPGAWLASETSVVLASSMSMCPGSLLRSSLSGTGVVHLTATGSGYLAISSFGSVHRYSLRQGETRVVDNGHVVAWSTDMKYTVGMASSGMLASMTSGEGLVCRFVGPGEVYVQSHSAEGLSEALSGSSGQSRPSRSRSPGAVIAVCMVAFIFVGIVTAMLVYNIVEVDSDGGHQRYR